MEKIASGDALPLKSFWINDELLTPDAGDVIVSCTNQSGVTVHSATVGFDADYGIPQGQLVVSSDVTLSFFNLVVKFEANNQSYTYRKVIRAHTDFMLIYQPSDVRAVLGVSEEELPNEDIDLMFSLSQLVREIGTSVLQDDLINVNETIKYGEALRQLPSLQLKVLQKDEVDDVKKTRLSGIKLSELKTELSANYLRYKSQLSNAETYPIDPLVTVVARDDIITGA